MPWFARFEEHDDLVALQQLVAARLATYRASDGAYVERVISFERILATLDAARFADSVALQGADKPEQPAKPKKEAPAPPARLCPTHPNYQAKRRPRTECEGCWGAYSRLVGQSQADRARGKLRRQTRDG